MTWGVVGWGLLFRSESCARWLFGPLKESQSAAATADELTPLAFAAVGVLLMGSAGPMLFGQLSGAVVVRFIPFGYYDPISIEWYLDLFRWACQFAIGFYLFAGSQGVVWLWRRFLNLRMES